MPQKPFVEADLEEIWARVSGMTTDEKRKRLVEVEQNLTDLFEGDFDLDSNQDAKYLKNLYKEEHILKRELGLPV